MQREKRAFNFGPNGATVYLVKFKLGIGGYHIIAACDVFCLPSIACPWGEYGVPLTILLLGHLCTVSQIPCLLFIYQSIRSSLRGLTQSSSLASQLL